MLSKVFYSNETSVFWEILISLLLAVMGGAARVLNIKDSKRLRRSQILAELFISGFAGIMILMLAKALGLEGDWLGVISGMAGWIGPRLLDLVATTVMKRLSLNGSGSPPEAENAGTDEDE